MTKRTELGNRLDVVVPDDRRRVLVIGDLARSGAADAGGENSFITYRAFDEVTPAALAALRPDIVLSPLVSPPFDCFDVAELLMRARFRGPYRALAPGLPNPALVRRELVAHFPGLDFDLLPPTAISAI